MPNAHWRILLEQALTETRPQFVERRRIANAENAMFTRLQALMNDRRTLPEFDELLGGMRQLYEFRIRNGIRGQSGS
jgi:hypothetical protein